MENKIKLFAVLFIAILNFTACFNNKRSKDSLSVTFRNDSVLISTESSKQLRLSIFVLNDNVSKDESIQDKYVLDLLSFIKKYSSDKLSLALYATKHNNSIPVRVRVEECIDTVINFKVNPLLETFSTATIKGVCAPLVASSSNPDDITNIKRWLFRKNEHLSDSLLSNMVGIVRELYRTNYSDYITNATVPVLKSFSGVQYSITSDMKADHYVLYACSSQQEIKEFVEEIVSDDFELTEASINHPLRCYRKTNSDGYKCITLIGINNDWSYQQQPLGLVAIDNTVFGNQGSNNPYIVFKNNIRVNLPSNKPTIFGDANIRITHSAGNGIACNVTFLTTFSGDIKSISIRRTRELCYHDMLGYDRETPGPKDFVVYTNKESSPHTFSVKLHWEDGDNFVPYIIEDHHGNKHEGKISYRASFERSNAPQINIDNNIDIYN